MGNDTLIQKVRKRRLGMMVVGALLGIHGLFLIIIGLIAFFGAVIGAYEVSHGHTTPATVVRVLGVFLAWILLLEGILFCLCAQGLWRWQRWAFWVTIALEVTNLIVASCMLKLQFFLTWPLVLSMGLAGSMLLSVLLVIDPRALR